MLFIRKLLAAKNCMDKKGEYQDFPSIKILSEFAEHLVEESLSVSII